MAEPPELGVAATLEFVGHPAFMFSPPRLGCERSLSIWHCPGPSSAKGMGFPHRLRIQQLRVCYPSEGHDKDIVGLNQAAVGWTAAIRSDCLL